VKQSGGSEALLRAMSSRENAAKWFFAGFQSL